MVEERVALHDIGSLAHWAVSSAKPGYGVENIKDANPATLWLLRTWLGHSADGGRESSMSQLFFSDFAS
jgi:hypothetical protein